LLRCFIPLHPTQYTQVGNGKHRYFRIDYRFEDGFDLIV
jgi:hypothetical protein